MRRKKDRLCVCKLRERNGTDAGCCILPASAGMRRWNGWQRTGIAGRWQGMWSAVKAGVAGWRVARLMAVVTHRVAEWLLVELVWVRLLVKAVLWLCPKQSMAAPTGVVPLLKASM
jgi:hypothetical protein